MKQGMHLGLALLAMAALAIPGTAWADVMEIDASGYSWTSGGPRSDHDATAVQPQGDAASGLGGESGDPALVAGADTPLDGAFLTAQERIDETLHPGSVTQALDAAGPMRWREAVARLARKYDISPALLEAVVWQESRWNEVARSPVGARGLAQLMPGTAAQMGVNPGDPAANLEGGARYLRMQLDAFDGNIEKALAAYNAGPTRVIAAGGVPNIRETRAYVAAIMARLTDPVRSIASR